MEQITLQGISKNDILWTIVSYYLDLLKRKKVFNVQISSTDRTEDYLINKLAGGTGITLTKSVANGREVLTISADGGALLDEKVKVSSTDTTAGFLGAKLLATSPLEITVTNPSGNAVMTVKCNVDDSSIGINSDTGNLEIKALGVTSDKLGAGAVTAGKVHSDLAGKALEIDTGGTGKLNILIDDDTIKVDENTGQLYVDIEAGDNDKVRIDAADIAAGYLEDKLKEGNAIELEREDDSSFISYKVNVEIDGETIDVNGDNQLEVPDGGIDTDQIANEAVTEEKLGSDVDYNAISSRDAATDVTGAELEELTDGSTTNLHKHLSAGIEGVSVLSGFVNRVDSTIGMNNNEFQIEGTFDIYVNGVLIHKDDVDERVSINNDNTLHYVYYNHEGTLLVSTTAWDIMSSTEIPVALVFRQNATTYAVTDERHTCARNRAWHKWAHNNIGAMYYTGLEGTFTNTTFSIDQGIIADEDLVFDTGGAKTTTTHWYRTDDEKMNLAKNKTTIYSLGGGGNVQYDNGSGTLVNLGNNKFGVHWVYCSNDNNEPIYTVIGQAEYDNIAQARAASAPIIHLSTAEWKLLYLVIYRNTVPTPTFVEAIDFRSVQTGVPVAGYNPTVHASLAGRDAENSHPASAISVDADGFSGHLTSAVDDAQKLAEAVDELVFTPELHASTHELGGDDEIDVSGLSGELADAQEPKAHGSSHTDGTDNIAVGDGLEIDDDVIKAKPDGSTIVFNISGELEAVGGGGGDNDKVKVSPTDSTAGFLEDKLKEADGGCVNITEDDNAGNKYLELDVKLDDNSISKTATPNLEIKGYGAADNYRILAKSNNALAFLQKDQLVSNVYEVDVSSNYVRYNTIDAALTAAAAASHTATNRGVILIYPGLYSIVAPLQMVEHVDIIGVSERGCQIQTEQLTSSIIQIVDNVTLKDVTLINAGTSDGVVTTGNTSNIKIQNVIFSGCVKGVSFSTHNISNLCIKDCTFIDNTDCIHFNGGALAEATSIRGCQFNATTTKGNIVYNKTQSGVLEIFNSMSQGPYDLGIQTIHAGSGTATTSIIGGKAEGVLWGVTALDGAAVVWLSNYEIVNRAPGLGETARSLYTNNANAKIGVSGGFLDSTLISDVGHSHPSQYTIKGGFVHRLTNAWTTR